MRPDAAVDLFSFVLALDMAMVANYGRQPPLHINSRVQAYYVQTFVLAWLTSIILLIYSTGVQAKIIKQVRRTRKYYPVGEVFVCWFFALLTISFHLWAVLGA